MLHGKRTAGGPFSFLPRILWTAEKVRSRTDTPRYSDIFIACIVDDETRAGWQPQIGQDRRRVGRQVRGAQRLIEIGGVRVFASGAVRFSNAASISDAMKTTYLPSWPPPIVITVALLASKAMVERSRPFSRSTAAIACAGSSHVTSVTCERLPTVVCSITVVVRICRRVIRTG